MLSVLTISQGSEGLPFYRRFQNEGCISKYWSRTGIKYKGVRCVSNYRDTIESSDIVLITSPGMGGLGEEINAGGRVVIGGTRFGDFLITPDGIKSFLKMLDNKPLEDGIPVSFLGIYRDGTWLLPAYAALTYTRLMDKDKGPYIPYAGNVGMYFKNGLALDKLFGSVAPLLDKSGFNGVIEIQTILYEDEFRIMNFQPFCTPLIFNFIELLIPSLSEYIMNPFIGEENFRLEKVSMGVQLTIPNYEVPKGIEVIEQAKKHFWKMDEDGINSKGVLGWSTAWGKDVVEAYRRTYRTVKKIVKKPDVQYREDIGFKKINAEDVFFILKEWGWIDATIRRKVQQGVREECERVNPQIQEDGKDREVES
jgi:hypothetical protein